MSSHFKKAVAWLAAAIVATPLAFARAQDVHQAPAPEPDVAAACAKGNDNYSRQVSCLGALNETMGQAITPSDRALSTFDQAALQNLTEAAKGISACEALGDIDSMDDRIDGLLKMKQDRGDGVLSRYDADPNLYQSYDQYRGNLAACFNQLADWLQANGHEAEATTFRATAAKLDGLMKGLGLNMEPSI